MGETLGKLVALLRSPEGQENALVDPRRPKRLVEIDTAPNGRADVCTIRIRDNGIGIAESELKSIFSGVYRGHASRDGELGNSGLGLGLSIVHGCIGALKGDVHVESERGTGTTVSDRAAICAATLTGMTNRRASYGLRPSAPLHTRGAELA